MRSVHIVALAAAGLLSLSGAAWADGTSTVGATTQDSGLNEQRIICKKHIETGSLVRKVKRCFTRTEWARIAESEQNGTRRMVDELQSKPGPPGGN